MDIKGFLTYAEGGQGEALKRPAQLTKKSCKNCASSTIPKNNFAYLSLFIEITQIINSEFIVFYNLAKLHLAI